ncbi:phosphoglycerate mutase-like protein [Punctularia strigosozonata HHB-11173 SS5]|uniref:phosphoglycerate mutase-like protein n=1 Tax=Punctularia strigosozonata (strain HHB-11173) TaxID=741275 RepID=UPI0004416DA5|nr:phosphoglycerate mutase-like protein [Punctularia strigosozonata HHB-11173 SS5]EIN14076.1 phosphoglycerate mutase-like protein [Punctularia strigosozonata HHB-11173 SS5]
MPQQPRPLPRLILIRHGETEWSINGRHTGVTDIPLTPRGEATILQRREQIVGPGKLIDPANLCTVFVSPRQRAHKTFHLLFDHLPELPKHELTPTVREWDYGDYEGLDPEGIKAVRPPGAPTWDIWQDGCPGGESVADMTCRADDVISKVREYHRAWKEEGKGSRDVVICAHGHFNRVLIARWMNMPLCLGTHFNFEPSGVAVLSYNHNNLAEPALNGLNLYAM